jgi:hypothetical protein
LSARPHCQGFVTVPYAQSSDEEEARYALDNDWTLKDVGFDILGKEGTAKRILENMAHPDVNNYN